MEEENQKSAFQRNECFISLLKKAKEGDSTSVIEIMEIFEPEIHYLARFIKLPKEDAVQSLKAELIELILHSDVSY